MFPAQPLDACGYKFDQMDMLTFPSGMLSFDSIRLPILYQCEEWIACSKPASLAMTEKETRADSHNYQNLIQAIRQRIAERVPSFQEAFPAGWGAVYYLEQCCGGVVLFARSAQSLSELRESYGSYRWKFRFLLFTRKSPPDPSLTCDLPIALKKKSAIGYISHRSGKKAVTQFQRLGETERLQVWQAELAYLRATQIPLHATESGLSIAGEDRFEENNEVISRKDLPGKRRPGDERNILWPYPAYYLSEIELPGGIKIESPLPKIFQRLVDHKTNYPDYS